MSTILAIDIQVARKKMLFKSRARDSIPYFFSPFGQSHFTFSAVMRSLAVRLQPKCSDGLKYCPCPSIRCINFFFSVCFLFKIIFLLINEFAVLQFLTMKKFGKITIKWNQAHNFLSICLKRSFINLSSFFTVLEKNLLPLKKKLIC